MKVNHWMLLLGQQVLVPLMTWQIVAFVVGEPALPWVKGVVSRISNFTNTSIVFVKVNALDEDNVIMNLEFSIRETTCRADSGEDPSSCAFQRGYYVVSMMGEKFDSRK